MQESAAGTARLESIGVRARAQIPQTTMADGEPLTLKYSWVRDEGTPARLFGAVASAG
jgi:hypothetical protein